MQTARYIKRSVRLLRNDSLFRNAAFLITSTAITAALGFGFWIFVARFYPTGQVGIASALISVTTLLSGISLVGLDAGLIRFLPKSESPNADINAAIIATCVLSAVAAVVYSALNSTVFHQVTTLLSGWWGAGVFTLIMIAVSLNSLTDSVFIANRKTQYHTIVYTVFGVVKLIGPMGLVAFGWAGIFSSYALAAVAATLLSFYFMVRICRYTLAASPSWRFIRLSKRYSFNNYLGSLIAGIPAQILPLVIIQNLGASQAAYFAMAWTMANLLYIAPSSITESLLAEIAHHPERKNQYVRHASKILALILVPTIGIAIVAAPYILKIFGTAYAAGSTTIFQLLAISAVFVSISSVCNTVLNIEHRTSAIVLARIVTFIVTLATVVPLMRFGLPGIGVAMTLGYAASNIAYIFIFKFKQHSELHMGEEPVPTA